ncbi:hypothetical protein P2318_17670 [Myxococcaceae bacterium GXIMD 01537]
MKRIRGVALAWMVCGLWLTACGGIEPEEYGESRDEALCHRQARCGEFRDEETCVRARSKWNQALREAGLQPYAVFEGSLEAGRTRFDEDRAQECIDLIRDSSCEQPLEEVMSAEACSVLVGQRKDGEACLVNEDCGAASYCALATERAVCDAGTCQPLPGLGERMPGFNNIHSCAPGLSPDENSICQPTSGENGPCQNSLRCAVGLTCDRDLHQCRRPGRVGESCGESERPCLSHLHCAEGRCRELSNVGESCTRSYSMTFGWRSDCMRGLFCDAASDASQGTCKVWRGAGSECRDQSECQSGLFCDQRAGQQSRTCQEGVGEGGKCDTAICAPGLTCSLKTFTCARRGRKGEACEVTNTVVSFACTEGLACIEGTCQVAFPGLCGAP